MYVVIVRFEVRPEHVDAFTGRVIGQARDSLDTEPACRRFDVSVDPDNRGRVCLYEIYDDERAFELHLASEHFARFDAETRGWVESKVVERWQLLEAPDRPAGWLAQ